MASADWSTQIHEVLASYWGYRKFRPLQEEIILSVLEGNDTLALLPTGGGKSICFQVPALLREGLCIVVTPLIALMKDQVEQLQKRRIPAAAIYSGMSKREIDILLDNCIYGKVKFLYLSPERLKTPLFQERAKKMSIGLLAIDEAHCISQWGYDFRPAYLEIAHFRESKPEVPLIAVTATATEIVKGDIQDKLQFKKEKNVFQKSFSRANLSYSTFLTEQKEKKLLEILTKVKGTAIVYVRSRKGTKEIAQFLQKNGIKADYYHGGLNNERRTHKQADWIQNKTRVIVATNAFGMGIDKPDVRVVIHLELPDTLEAYYQEAGRAGRDEQKAYAVVLFNKEDTQQLEIRIRKSYPELATIQKVYQALANYLQLAVGSGEMQSFDFDWVDFIQHFNLESVAVYHTLRILEGEGVIQLSEGYHSPSKVLFNVDNKELYAFQVANPKYEPMIQLLLRMYGGELFNSFKKISEKMLAQKGQTDVKTIVNYLVQLDQRKVLHYEKQKEKPQITFLLPRSQVSELPIDLQKINARKERDLRKAKAVVHYAQHENRCRTQLLLEYFGEVSYEPCGVCDICLRKKKEKRLSENHYERYRERILKALAYKSLSIEALVKLINPQTKEALLEALQKIIDVGEVEYNDEGKLKKV
ncbi:MAG: ATP-dependent DNA helicase RecQ [Thermonemataceae bacterium]